MAPQQEETPEALFETGKRFYLSSHGSSADPALALHYFDRAARMGFSPAQRLLGICFLEGNIVAKDFKQAWQWLSAAAEQNDSQALYSLALMYAQGLGVEKNWATAYDLLTRPGTNELQESKELKRRLKHELIKLYPNLTAQLESVEKTCRIELNPRQSRFIQPWLSSNRLDDDRDEFEIWLALNLGRMAPENAFNRLSACLTKYYETQKKSTLPLLTDTDLCRPRTNT